MRKITFSQWLQILLIIGIGVLIWQIVILRQTIETKNATLDQPVDVNVVNDVKLDTLSQPIEVEVTNEPNVNVSNEVDVNVTNSSLEVNATVVP
jgi:hypothetical protein